MSTTEKENQDFAFSLGGGCRWYSEDVFAENMGMTVVGFRSLCKALSVPMIHIGNMRLVSLPMFRVAMWAISRIGQPDFLAPGSARMRKRIEERLGNSTTKLDLEALEENMEDVVAELVYARRVDGKQLDETTRDLSLEAARRIIQSAVTVAPREAMLRFSRRARELYDRREPTSLSTPIESNGTPF